MKNEDLYKLLEEYKTSHFTTSLEEQQQLINEYIYSTNKLEGNKLTLAQTTSLIEKGFVSGENIRLHDLLESKGMYKAIQRMWVASNDKEKLSIELLKELNGLALSSLWADDNSYITSKKEGQKEYSFKVVENYIRVTIPDKEPVIINPLSTPETVDKNMIELIDKVNNSTQDCITKSAYLAQEIWLHQPFIDGNKRTGRLLINFMTMKEGYPLFSFEDKSKNYNSLLIQQYIEKKPGLVVDYIREQLHFTMKKAVAFYNETKQSKGNGFRFIL